MFNLLTSFMSGATPTSKSKAYLIMIASACTVTAAIVCWDIFLAASILTAFVAPLALLLYYVCRNFINAVEYVSVS